MVPLRSEIPSIYIKNERENLKVTNDSKALLFLDLFQGQATSESMTPEKRIAVLPTFSKQLY